MSQTGPLPLLTPLGIVTAFDEDKLDRNVDGHIGRDLLGFLACVLPG